jgi:hypothetical protein
MKKPAIQRSSHTLVRRQNSAMAYAFYHFGNSPMKMKWTLGAANFAQTRS